MKTFRSLIAAGVASVGLFMPVVWAAPTLVQNPILGNAIQSGTSVNVQVTVSGTPGPVSVQWYKQGVPIPGAVTVPDPTTGVARYLLGVLSSPADQGPYSAVATDDTGSSANLVLRDYQYVVDRSSFSWRHPFPTGISLNAVAASHDGDFLLMGGRGYFASSQDGDGGWEQSPSFTSDGVSGYAFGNHRHLVRIGSGRFLSVAANGSDRVSSGLPAGYGTAELLFAQGLFVALGNNGTTSGKIFTSLDGKTWTEQYSGAENLFEATFGGGKFAVSTASGKILLSPDGLNWGPPAASPLSAVWMLRYASDRFFLGGGAGELYSSVDGSTWTALTSGLATKITDLAYDGAGHYVLIGDADGIRTSMNGTDWAVVTLAANTSAQNTSGSGNVPTNLLSLAYSHGVWLAVGNNSGAQNANLILRSTDNGATWGRTSGFISTGQLNAVAARDTGDANASIVAVGNSGQMYRATDEGWNWQGVSSGTGSNLNDITYTNAYYVAGGGGLVRTSADGLTWSTLVTGNSNALLWVGNLNGNLHVAGATGTLLKYSGTGATSASWSTITTGSTAQLNGAAYGMLGANPTYIAVGNGGVILKSANGSSSSWSSTTVGTQTLNEVAYGAGKFVAVGNNGTIIYSTDGTTWTSSGIQTNAAFTHVAFTSGLFMVSGSESAVMVSPDGINWKAKLTHTSQPGTIRATAAFGGRVYGVGQGGSVVAADLVPQIENVTVTENVTTGGSATFAVEYFEPLLDTTIQWTKGGFDIPGANSATYTIPAATRADAGAYAVTLTTSARDTGSDPVLLAVAPTQQPGVFTADPTFNPDPITLSARVYAGLKLSNNPNLAGKWLAGGDFVRWENSFRPGLVRLNADLSLDPTYTPPVFSGFVLALAEAPDGSIYVGGDFTAVDGHLRNGLARLKPDLTLDLAWQPADGAPRSQVSALAVDSSGKVLVARNSGGSGFITGTNVVRRLNQNGTLDGGFSVDVTLGFGRIFNLIVESSGAVVIGGQFTLGTHLNIARVDSTGAVDANFAGSSGADNTVFALKRLADGRYLAGGQFANIGGSARNHVAIINDTTGALDSYTPATGMAGGNAVRGLTVLNGGDLLLGGDFTSYGGTATWGLMRLNGSTGAVVQGYTTSGTAVGFPGNGAGRNLDFITRPDGSVAIFGGFQSVLNQRRVGVAALNVDGTLSSVPNSVAYRPAYANNLIVEGDGRLTLGGSMEIVAGVGGKFGSVRLNPNGTLDTSYPVGTGFAPNGLSVFGLFRLLRQADGKTLAIGDITGYNGTASNKLVRLNADGTADTSFAIQGAGPNVVFPGTVLLQGGRTLLYNFGGGYNGSNVGTNGVGPLVRLNADGTRDTTFAAGGFNGGISQVFEFPDADGTLVVTGNFSLYNSQPAPGIAVINPMGGLVADADIGSGVTPSGTINGMTVVPGNDGGNPLFFGNFTTFNGVIVNRIAIHDDTQANLLRAGFMAASVIDGPVGQVVVQEDGKLIVVGDFSGSPVYRLMPNGDVDPTFALRGITGIAGGNGAALRVAVGDDGSLYVYGAPISINYGAPRSVVRFSVAPVPASIAVPPNGSEVSLNGSTILSVKAAGTAPYTYQWKRNGDDVPGATGSVLVLNNIQLSDLGDYTVAVSNGAGSPAVSSAAFVGIAPTITANPVAALILTAGQDLSLAATAQGVSASGMQWSKNGSPQIGATGFTFTRSNVAGSDVGIYTAVASNSYGVATSTPSLVTVAVPGGDTFPSFAWRNPLPAGGSLRGVAYGAGKFVGVGNSGRVVSSTDGSSWTSAANIAGNTSLNAVTFSSALNLFIGVGSSGDIYTAPGSDVTTWTKRTTSVFDFLNSVAVGTAGVNHIIVAVGNSGRVLTSADGVNWTSQAISGSPQLTGVAAAADVFVAVGTGNGQFYTSTNGTSWSAGTPPAGLTSSQFNAVRYLNGQFVAVGNGGAVMTWTGTGSWAQVAGTFRSMRDITAVGTTYVAATDNGEIVKSTNLASWQNVSVSGFGTYYGVAASGTTYAMVGAGGEIQTSNDATTWTSRGSAGGFWRFSAVEFLNGKFVAVGSVGAIYTSADGSSWKRESVPVGHWLNAAGFGNGVYVVPSGFGDILTSPDASTWTTRTVGDTVSNNGVTFDGTRFVVVGDSGKIRTSTNGSAWSDVTGTGITGSLRSVVAKPGLIVAVGDSGKIYTSTDGSTWVERVSNTAQRLWRVRVIEGTFFAVGDNRTVLASADGVTWMPLPISSSIGFAYRDIRRLSDGFYIVADQGLVLKTADLRTATSLGNVAASETINGLGVGAGRVVIAGEGAALLESVLPAVGSTPAITVQPASFTTDATRDVVLAVNATASGPLTYQWKKGTAEILGATSSTLLIPAAATSATGSYTVVVTSGGNSVTSDPAVVNVNALAAPAITALPIGAQVITGTANLSVTATGTAPLTYQWYRGLSGDTSNPVSTNASFNTAALSQTERYWVKITNFAGQVLNSPTTSAIAMVPRNGPLASTGISGIAYSGSKYAAVAGSAILTSTNGTAWSRATGLTGSFFNQIAYGNSTFAAVGNSGAIRVSTDNGVTWTSSTFGSASFNGICFDGTQFVAVGVSGVVATSLNGSTWTSRTALAGTPTMRAIAFINGVYVAVGDNGAIQTSNGVFNGGTQPTWTSRSSGTTNALRAIAADASATPRIVAVGDNGTVRLSTDTTSTASTWTAVNSPSNTQISGVVYANSKFTAVTGSQFITSADGSNWGSQTFSVLPLGNLGMNAVVYAGGRYLIGGFPGVIISSDTGAEGSWTLRSGASTAALTDLIHGGGVYLGVGNNGSVVRSADGINYNVKSPAVSGLDFVTLRRVAYGKGTFVAVGDGGTILSSPDGQLWIQRASGGSAYLAAAFGNNKFVVAGAGGVFAASSDGATWTTGTGAIGGSNVTALSYGAGVFVAVNNVGGIYTSADGASWTPRASGVASALNNVAFAGGQFVAVGSGSTILTSPDGVTWAVRTLGTTSINLTGIACGDGMYLATHSGPSNSSLLFASPDGITWNSANVSGGVVGAFSSTTVAFGNGAFLIAGGNALMAQTVPAPEVPRITLQPASQAITGGQTVTLSVNVVGSSPTYQWYEGATGDVSLPVGTNATFTTPSLLQSKRYWVRVTAGGQTFESDTAQLLGPPAIISGPTSRMVNDGTVLTLSVNAIGAAPLSYVWKYNNTTITGANGPTYTLNPVSLSNAGNYSVTVSNGAGIASTSNAAISVAPVAPTVGGIASTFGRNVPVGANTELSVAVSGTPTLTYQWRRNNTTIPGATKSTYFITNAKATDSGTYSVVVTNAQGNGTSSDFGLLVTPELGWQWRNPLPTGNGLSSVTAINNKFYLGGLRSTMLVSDNGTTWTSQAISGTGNIFSVAYGAGRIVALGGLNAIYTSDDGVTWTPRDSKIQDTNSLQTVAYGAGRFVAVGFNGHTATSEDGITWTPGQVPTSVANDYLYWIRYVESKFWVSSSDDDTVRTWTSTDGLNWTQPALTLPANTFIGQVAFGNGVYVATTEGDLLWSADGVTWSAAGFGPVGDDMPTLRYVNDRFVAVGTNGAIATSTNGQTWTPQVSGVTSNLNDVAFANGVYVISGSGVRTILTSSDAVTWTSIVTGPATNLNGVATGNGKLVAVGNVGAIVTSADGLAWTSATSGVTNNLNDVAYGAGKFVAVGLSGRVLTAADTNLASWSLQTISGQPNLRRVSFGNSRFFAVADNGVSLTSTDGTTWTVNAASSGAFFGTTFGAGLQIGVGNNGGLFSSADNGATWTNRAGSLINTGYSDVLFANGKFVAVGVAGVAATSTDGLTWTQVPAFTSDNLSGLVLTNGFWIATGGGSTYYVSADGVTWSPRYTGVQDSLRDFVVYGNQVIGVGVGGTIIAAGAPVFVAPPVPTAARAGGNVTLSALVGASPIPVTYQWQKDGSNLSNGTGIAGVTTPTLTLTGITIGSAGQYRLVATNAIAPVTSPAAQLTVSQAPTFTSQPANFTAVATQGASFTASAVGTPAPTYQWQKDNVNIANGTLPNGTVVAGATTGTLILSNVQPEAVGSYRLIATNLPAGESTPISEPSLPATLTVNVLPAPVISGAVPAIASGTVTLIAGDNAHDDVTFTATATGTVPLNYQWRRNGLNLANGTFVSGATTNTLTLSNVPLNGGGNITVAVTNAATAVGGPVVSAPVSLVVNPPAPVIISPLSVSGVINTPFTYGIGINATTAAFGATNLPAGLTVNTSTGVISGVPTATGVYNTIALSATNTTNSDTKTLTITINPPPPIITSPVAATGRVNQGAPLTYTIVATNGASVTATPLPPGLTLSGNVISGTPTQAGTFTTTITATNATGSASQTVVFTINPALNAPVYTGSTQPSGTQNSLFNFGAVFTNVNATNGYAITSGTLPAGILLNANTGALTGTPTVVGTFPIALTATGPGGSLSVVLTIVINPAPSAPVVTSPSSATGTKGDLFSYTITTDIAATSYAAVVVTGSGTEPLPGWLALTGNVLSGTPPAAGTLSLRLAATASGLTGPGKLLVLTISPSPLAPVLTSSPYVSAGRVNAETTVDSPLYQIAATNSPTTFERTAGPTLESFGLQLEAATGKVFGIPTVTGIYKIWFAGSNVAGGRGPSMEVTFAIQPALNVPVITSNGTAAGQVGQSFSYAISATNSPTSYADVGLPANGLTRSGNLISGIPTTATVEPLIITVSAANADGSSVPKTVSITIAPAPATPVITSAGTASARVNSTFSYQMTASASPTSFNAVNLPPGLGIDPTTGIISGTPTQAGAFTATLSAANVSGLGVTSPLVFSVAPAPSAPAITSAPSATGKVGVDFTYTTTATNGPITNYAVSGTLPAGLSLNTTTGVISGAPVEPGFKVVNLTASSASGTSLPQSLIIVVDPADNVPVITSPIYALGTVGVDFSYTIAATNMPGGTPFPAAVTLDAVGLPPGLAVNPSTGVIQGQPSQAGVFVATLVGTNASGTGPARSLTIFVQPAAAAPVVTSGTTAAAQVGVGFSYQITATNNPLGYEVLGAPAWMTVNGQSGALGGTPSTPGVFVVLLVANNSSGASNPAPLALLVAAAANTPVVTSTRNAAGTMSADFTYTIQATNTPTSYLATGLPDGLTLNSGTGAITGRPNASGIYQVTISASNGNGAGQPVVLTLTIAPNLQIVL